MFSWVCNFQYAMDTIQYIYITTPQLFYDCTVASINHTLHIKVDKCSMFVLMHLLVTQLHIEDGNTWSLVHTNQCWFGTPIYMHMVSLFVAPEHTIFIVWACVHKRS